MSGPFISIWVTIKEANDFSPGGRRKITGFTDAARIGRHPYKEEKQKKPSPHVDDCCQIFLSLEEWLVIPSTESRFFNKITLQRRSKGIVAAGD